MFLSPSGTKNNSIPQKGIMNKKNNLIAGVVLLLLSSIILIAKNANEVQSIDGSQRNQITSGGGGGAGDVTSSGNNTFTGSNTVTSAGQIVNYGNTTLSNLTVSGTAAITFLGVGATNTTLSLSEYPLTIVNTNDGYGIKLVTIGAASKVSALSFSDPDGFTFAMGQTSDKFRFYANGGSIQSFFWSINNQTGFELSDSTMTLGDDSSYTYTFNGSSASIPNGLNFGSSQLNVTASGAITNNSNGIYSFGTITGSNIVSLLPASSNSVWTAQTGATNMIIDGSGSIPLQTKALFSLSTNTLTAALPIKDTFYTNNSTRLFLSANTAFSANSGGYLLTISGTFTQKWGRVFFPSAGTNYISGMVDPNALYKVTTESGTINLIPGEWNESRQ
jgi:hypothetical protein